MTSTTSRRPTFLCLSIAHDGEMTSVGGSPVRRTTTIRLTDEQVAVLGLQCAAGSQETYEYVDEATLCDGACEQGAGGTDG